MTYKQGVQMKANSVKSDRSIMPEINNCNWCALIENGSLRGWRGEVASVPYIYMNKP